MAKEVNIILIEKVSEYTACSGFVAYGAARLQTRQGARALPLNERESELDRAVKGGGLASVHVCHLPGQHLPPGIRGRRHTSRDKVML